MAEENESDHDWQWYDQTRECSQCGEEEEA